MKLLAICRPVPDIDQAEFRRLLPEEGATLGRLHASGLLREAYTPDGPGAVLMLEGEPAEITQRLAELPLAAAGLISVEVIPLNPLTLPGRPAATPGGNEP